MPRWNAKVDKTQAEVVEALRQAGASVEPIHREGRGIPDLLVGYNGHTLLIEVKSRGGRLTKPEQDWHREWRSCVYIVHDAQEAVDVLEDFG